MEFRVSSIACFRDICQVKITNKIYRAGVEKAVCREIIILLSFIYGILSVPLNNHRHAIPRARATGSNPTFTVEELVVAAGLGLSDDTLHPPVCHLNIETLVGIRRVNGHVLPPLLLRKHLSINARGSAT